MESELELSINVMMQIDGYTYLNLPKPSNFEDVQNLQDIDLKTRLSHFDDSQRIFFLKCILKDDASPLGLILR